MLLRKADRAGGTDPRTGRPILPLSEDEAARVKLLTVAALPAQNDAIFSAARRAGELGLGELQGLLADIAKDADVGGDVPDLALTVVANACLEKPGKVAVQQSPKLLHTLKERVKDKGSQEKIA